jgi:hypothetical protein
MTDPQREIELQRRVIELEAQLRLAQFEIEREQVTAQSRVRALEATLGAERELRATIERTVAEQRSASEDAYEARIAQLRTVVELWRSDDHPGLAAFLTARVASLDSSLAYLESPAAGELSPSMLAATERARTERAEIIAVLARLGDPGD